MQKLLTVASLSILLGIIFNWVVRGNDPNLGLFLFLTGVIASAIIISRRYIATKKWQFEWLTLIICAIILFPPLIRSNVFATVFYFLLYPAFLLALIDRIGYRKPIGIMSGLAEMIVRYISSPLSYLYSLLNFLTHEIGKKQSKGKHPARTEHIPQILIGVILAIPALFIFTALFGSADPAFEKLLSLESFVNWLAKLELWSSMDDLIVVIFIAAMLFGWFAIMLTDSDPLQSALLKLKRPIKIKGFDPTIFTTFFTLLSVLFGIFVLVQAQYLFGGSEQIISETTGLTFAQYARRGFVELLLSSSLVIGIATILLTTVDRSKLNKWLKTPYYLLVTLTLLIGMSAHYRLFITEEYYGLTNIRLTGHLLMLGAMSMLVLLIRAVSVQRLYPYLNRYSLYILLAVILPLVILPTDRLVSVVNWGRYEDGENFDLAYNLNLSDEATSLNLKRAENSGSETIELITKAHYARQIDHENDWRSWDLYESGIKKYEDGLTSTSWKTLAEADLANFISEYSGALKNKDPQLIKQYWSDAIEYEDSNFESLDDLIVLGYTPVEIPDFKEWYLLSYDPLGVPQDWYGLYIPVRFNYKAEQRSSGEMIEQCKNDAIYVRLERGEWKITSAEVVWFGELEVSGEEWVHALESIPRYADPYHIECPY